MKEGPALVLLSASQDQSSRDQPGTSAEAAGVVQAVTTTGSIPLPRPGYLESDSLTLAPAPDGDESRSRKRNPASLAPPSVQGEQTQRRCRGPTPLHTSVSGRAHAPQPLAGSARERLASYWSRAREPIGVLGGVATDIYPMGSWGRDRTYPRAQWSCGRRGPPGGGSLSWLGVLWDGPGSAAT